METLDPTAFPVDPVAQADNNSCIGPLTPKEIDDEKEVFTTI